MSARRPVVGNDAQRFHTRKRAGYPDSVFCWFEGCGQELARRFGDEFRLIARVIHDESTGLYWEPRIDAARRLSTLGPDSHISRFGPMVNNGDIVRCWRCGRDQTIVPPD